MSQKARIVVALVGLFLVAPGLAGQNDEAKKLKELMHKKLEHSRKVLEGVALGDFGKIANLAEDLMLISKAAEWRVHKTLQYEVHSNQFRRTIENLLEMAKQKNLDGAALSYVDLTLTCVKCHKYVRGTRMTRLDDDDQPTFTLNP